MTKPLVTMISPHSKPNKLGKYEILEVIGRGGMGVVYKAIDPEIGRLVGIKMMTSTIISDPDLLKRFYREAQSCGRLQHPNIITIYDLGVHEGSPYLVMEFLEGESLDGNIKARRPMSLEDKLDIGIQLCNGLAYAHERNIVHRDVKPGNVMLLKDGTVKIVDFGIARGDGDRVTRTGQVMGSIQYMSPEQINGAPVDQRTDIFSAGVLLYQVLTYSLPFEGKDTGDTLLKIIHGTPPPLSQVLPNSPPELESILQRALAKNPEERYQTATELALDLAHVQDQLKHERVSEYLQNAEGYIAEKHWAKAQEQLLQVLKLDRQNARSSTLLRVVQQEIQKQQRSERAKDLRCQADQALAKGEFDDALRYLGMAVDLVPTDNDLGKLRDSVREMKATLDRLSELLRRAESAHDAGDLEDALAASEEALGLDADNTEAKALQAVIKREIADRVKLKQVQSFIDEARKQISARRFTAALEVLKKAENLDPAAAGVNELISLASTGQQQERRRKELEQIASEVQEALNRSDYAFACQRAEVGLRKFPDDRGLLKLKALADKERDAYEKRTYIETQISSSRRLLEEHRGEEALRVLGDAMSRYPDEFVLLSMHALVTESVEREQAEQIKTQTIQQAKDAIRRKAYNEAIAILQAGQQKTPCSEFEDLLLFAADEAAVYEKQLLIDSAAEEAHRLISAAEFGKAVSLLEETLKKTDDQELRIILADAKRQQEHFALGVREAIDAGNRLLQTQRFSEAVKFMEGQFETYGKSPEFCAALEQMRREERRLHAFSATKERVRDVLANSEFESALTLVEEFEHEFGSNEDTQLLRKEIETKREKAATLVVVQALNDVRILLLVNSYSAALGILDRIVDDVTRVAPELREKYENVRSKTETSLKHQREKREQDRLRQKALAERLSDQSTVEEAQTETADTKGERTHKASPAELERLLGEVTLLGQHYEGDSAINDEISDLRHQLTAQIAQLRGVEIQEEPKAQALEPSREQPGFESVPSEVEPAIPVDVVQQSPSDSRQEQQLDKTLLTAAEEEFDRNRPISAPTFHESPDVLGPMPLPTILPSADLTAVPSSVADREPATTHTVPETDLAQDVQTIEEKTLLAPDNDQARIVVNPPIEDTPAAHAAISNDGPAISDVGLHTDLEQPASPAADTLYQAEPAPQEHIREEEDVQDQGTPAIHLVEEPALSLPQEPAVLWPSSAPEQPQAAAAQMQVIPISTPDYQPARLRTSPVPAELPDPAASMPINEVRHASSYSQAEDARPRLQPAPVSTRRVMQRFPTIAPKGAFIATAVLIVIVASSIGLYLFRPPQKKAGPATSSGTKLTRPDPAVLQQKQAMADSDNLVAAGDLEGARQILQQAAAVNGPLAGEISKKLQGIEAATKDENLRKLRQREEQLWQAAQADVAQARFAAGQKELREIIALPQGATRREAAQHYLDETIPRRKKEELWFAQAQRGSQSNDPGQLQRARDLLGDVIAQDGPRKTEATELRSSVDGHLTALKQQREQSVTTLIAQARQALSQGNVRDARQKAEAARQLGADTGAVSAEIDQADKALQAKAAADAAFQGIVQRYRVAASANDKAGLESARSGLQAVAQAGGPHMAEAQNYVAELDRKLATLNQPVARATAPSKPAVSLPSDEEAIRAVVQRYAQAFENRDADELRQIWPSLNSSMYASYQTNFANARAIRMQVDIKNINVGADAASATVSAVVTQKYTPNGFSARNSKDSALFQLIKKGEAWYIREVR